MLRSFAGKAHLGDVPKERPRLHPPTRLRLQRSRHVVTEATRGMRGVDGPFDDGQRVPCLGRLHETVAAKACDLEAAAADERGQASPEPTVVHEGARHGVHGGLQWIMVTERHRAGRVVAIEDR